MLVSFQAAQERLCKEWQNKVGKKGCHSFLDEFTQIVDEYILSSCKGEWPGAGKEIALIALGGYGRKEMYPHSDIDLMLLYAPAVKRDISRIADAIFYPLWDTGMELGHGVRTVKEAIKHADEEFFFRVAMLDARLLYGSSSLFEELQDRYKKAYVTGHREKFIREMRAFRSSRLDRYGGESYLLEPHIKDGLGGMRDIQAMLWSADVVFGLHCFKDFQEAGLLFPEELVALESAIDFLTCLRLHIHLLSRRKNDQLYFEHQDALARIFGYHDQGGIRGVERFMTEVYGALQTVHTNANLFFEHVGEVLGFFDKTKQSDRVLEKGIEIRSGRILLTATSEQVEKKPLLLIRVFLAMARNGLPIHHRARQYISLFLPYFGEKERTSPRLAKAFFASMIEAKNIIEVLVTMMETGMLQAIIPEFNRINRLAQYDLYHIYTVDRHSLQTVAELHAELNGGNAGKLAGQISSPKIVYLAALIHDIGKGSGRDHSEEGAYLSGAIGKRLSFTDSECDTLEFLVRYHLYIPENAMRRDLEDTAFISNCVSLIGSSERLAMLYLLSVADSKATGPSAWSQWKATLMEDMFLKINSHFSILETDSHDFSTYEKSGVDWLRAQVHSLLDDEKNLKIDPDLLSNDYIANFSAETISRHILLQRDNYNQIKQRSLLFAEKQEDGWDVLIMTKDQHGLLAKICGILTLNNLSVQKAQIFTWYGSTVVDHLSLKAAYGITLSDVAWSEIEEQLNKAMTQRFGLDEKLCKKLADIREKQRGKMVNVLEKRVFFDNDVSEKYSVLEVHAADLPGQLYYICQRLADCGIQIHRAFIATEVELLIDVFYILDQKGEKVIDMEEQERIAREVLKEVVTDPA